MENYLVISTVLYIYMPADHDSWIPLLHPFTMHNAGSHLPLWAPPSHRSQIYITEGGVASSSPCIIHESSWQLLSHWPVLTHGTRLWPSHGTHEMKRQRQWRDRATKSLSGLHRCISEDIKGPKGLDRCVIKAQCIRSSGGFTCVCMDYVVSQFCLEMQQSFFSLMKE